MIEADQVEGKNFAAQNEHDADSDDEIFISRNRNWEPEWARLCKEKIPAPSIDLLHGKPSSSSIPFAHK